MTPNEYQELAMRTAPDGMFPTAMLDNAALGLCGESGEFADMIKKTQYQGHRLDIEHAAKELGDVLWYVAMACTALQYDMEEIMRMNIEKLRSRYPDGFDPSRSVNRAEGDV